MMGGIAASFLLVIFSHAAGAYRSWNSREQTLGLPTFYPGGPRYEAGTVVTEYQNHQLQERLGIRPSNLRLRQTCT